jgi:hypothetical protein
MIKLFGQTDVSFASNGDVVLLPLKSKVHKEDYHYKVMVDS